MKRWPVCQRTYTEHLKFCRVDGAALISSSASTDSEATIDLSVPPSRLETRRQESHEIPSIAVLPFLNISADPENDYFCDGLAEELLNALAHIEGLKVAARTSELSRALQVCAGTNETLKAE
jgi:hypothetical protein